MHDLPCISCFPASLLSCCSQVGFLRRCPASKCCRAKVSLTRNCISTLDGAWFLCFFLSCSSAGGGRLVGPSRATLQRFTAKLSQTRACLSTPTALYFLIACFPQVGFVRRSCRSGHAAQQRCYRRRDACKAAGRVYPHSCCGCVCAHGVQARCCGVAAAGGKGEGCGSCCCSAAVLVTGGCRQVGVCTCDTSYCCCFYTWLRPMQKDWPVMGQRAWQFAFAHDYTS